MSTSVLLCPLCGAPTRDISLVSLGGGYVQGSVVVCWSDACRHLIPTRETSAATKHAIERALPELVRELAGLTTPPEVATLLGVLLLRGAPPTSCALKHLPLTNAWGEPTGAQGVAFDASTSDGPLLRGRARTREELADEISVAVRLQGGSATITAWVRLRDVLGLLVLGTFSEIE